MQATTTRISFLDRLERGDVLIADGATGTTCQHMGLPLGVAPEEWVLTEPERIIALHRGFAQAGSDIVLTCTFGGTSIRLADGPFSGPASELNRRAAELAREARRPRRARRRLARADGPAVRAARHAHARRGGRRLRRAGRGARRGRRRPARAGDDVLPDRGGRGDRRRAARRRDLPFVLAFSFDRGTRTMMGTTTAEVVALARRAAARPPSARTAARASRRCRRSSPSSPQRGRGPAAVGQAERRPAAHDGRLGRLRRHARQLGEAARGYVQAGARVVGGCCGSTPEHVRAIAEAIRRRSARSAKAASRRLAEEHEAHELDLGQLRQRRARRRDRDPCGELDRIAVDAGRDRGERDRAAAERRRDLERAPVARGQQRGLAALAAPPDRADGVDDVPRRQPARRRRLRIAGRAAAEQRGTRPGSPGPPARWIAPSTPPPPSSVSLAALTIASTHLLGDVAAGDLDASGHVPVSIDFAHAPAPILPRRPRLQPQDGRQGRDAPGRHGVHRPRGRRRAAGEERRHAAERRRRAHGPRVDGADARRARQRHRHHLVLPRHPLRRRGRPGRARLHHAAQGPGARSRGLRAPPADAARGRARHAQAHRARGPDRERARRREPAGDRRCLRPHRDDHLRARRLRRRPRHPAAQRGRHRRASTPATSGTPSSRAS